MKRGFLLAWVFGYHARSLGAPNIILSQPVSSPQVPVSAKGQIYYRQCKYVTWRLGVTQLNLSKNRSTQKQSQHRPPPHPNLRRLLPRTIETRKYRSTRWYCSHILLTDNCSSDLEISLATRIPDFLLIGETVHEPLNLWHTKLHWDS